MFNDTAIVIPWRATESRMGPFAHTVNHLAGALPGVPILIADSPADQRFSCPAARNRGVNRAQQLGYQRVVLCEADTQVEPQGLHAAIAACDDGVLHLPFDEYRFVHADGTEDTIAGSTGGCWVVTAAAYFAAGGGDEAFAGWGFDDLSFRVQCETLLGPTVVHRGTARHPWHERPETSDPGTGVYQRNLARWRRYENANGDPDAVRAVLTS